MDMSKGIHIVTNSKGKWSIKQNGVSRASKIFNTQNKAIDYVKSISVKQKVELFIHSKDGIILQKISMQGVM